jgi:hypothetical protein
MGCKRPAKQGRFEPLESRRPVMGTPPNFVYWHLSLQTRKLSTNYIMCPTSWNLTSGLLLYPRANSNGVHRTAEFDDPEINRELRPMVVERGAFAQRVDLTVRLVAAIYHFTRPQSSLRQMIGEQSSRPRHRSRTPAQAARLTNHRWTIQELLACPVPPVRAG